MENEIAEKSNLIEKINNIIKKNKRLLISALIILIIVFSVIILLNFYQKNQNEKISERYIKAGIYLSSNDKEKSKLIFKDIVLSKNKFYSILALNNIIENDLEENSDEILKLFKTIENINLSSEKKDLIKLKKALYFKKISRDLDGNKLLEEIIADNSIWKETAIEILR
tara:strand:+ start:456 stop:962 length:507 start_codon:yes stop_codon:yes gene_type:complete